MKKHGRKQKLKRASEFNLIYAKRDTLLLKNGKAVRKIKKQLNKRYRKEMKEEDMNDDR